MIVMLVATCYLSFFFLLSPFHPLKFILICKTSTHLKYSGVLHNYLMSCGKKNMIYFATLWPSIRCTPIKEEKISAVPYYSSISLCMSTQFKCKVVIASHLSNSKPSSFSPKTLAQRPSSSFLVLFLAQLLSGVPFSLCLCTNLNIYSLNA